MGLFMGTVVGLAVTANIPKAQAEASESVLSNAEGSDKESIFGSDGEQPCPDENGIMHPACQPIHPDPGRTPNYEPGNAEKVVEPKESNLKSCSN